MGAQSNVTCVFLGDQDTNVHRDNYLKAQGKEGVPKPRSRASEEPALHLDPRRQPPGLRINLCEPLVCGALLRRPMQTQLGKVPHLAWPTAPPAVHCSMHTTLGEGAGCRGRELTPRESNF